jgi:hypothetical protein
MEVADPLRTGPISVDVAHILALIHDHAVVCGRHPLGRDPGTEGVPGVVCASCSERPGHRAPVR